jgi:hypothetical protein
MSKGSAQTANVITDSASNDSRFVFSEQQPNSAHCYRKRRNLDNFLGSQTSNDVSMVISASCVGCLQNARCLNFEGLPCAHSEACTSARARVKNLCASLQNTTALIRKIEHRKQ